MKGAVVPKSWVCLCHYINTKLQQSSSWSTTLFSRHRTSYITKSTLRRRQLSTMATAATEAAKIISAPLAKKEKHEIDMFGDVRVDNYYWLRDDTRSNPDVLSHLRLENSFVDSFMSGTKEFEEQLYKEIRGRIKEDDVSVPVRRGNFYYYRRTLEGEEYVRYCRRAVSDTETKLEQSVFDTMPDGPDAPPEHVILDENVNAKEHDYYCVDAFAVSPNNMLVAYAEDTKGDEIYTLRVIDIQTREPVEKPLVGVTDDVEWAGDTALMYVTMDETLRPFKVWLHKLGTEQSSDCCLYHEKDDKFSVGLTVSESKNYVFVSSGSKTTRFVFYLDTSKPEEGLKVLTPRIEGVSTYASHRGNHFIIRRRSDLCFNSELLACPLDNLSALTILLPHRESVNIVYFRLFINHLVVFQREDGLPKVVVYNLPAAHQPLETLSVGRSVDFVDPVYDVDSLESPYLSTVLRFSYSSLRTPHSVFDHDMDTGKTVLKKTQTVLGGFDASNYVTERKWATASDGTRIPISVVYQKNLVKLDGSDPLLLYGYGSYQISIDPTFNTSRLSLLDRGIIFAIAHIRGGGEMGRKWYEDGKFLKKMNTFTDFICCAEYLIENKYCSKEKLCIHGRSAGGLLIGAVLNMRPELFKAAILGVPFVDVVTTMLDPTIPLTTSEYEEWGDPREREFYFYMKSYSPVDNVKAQKYPDILVTAGLNDPRVMYSEPAKFVAKLRELKTDNNAVLFKCEFGAGHCSKSGRFEKLQEVAFTYTFLLKTLNLIPALEKLQK
ncbi:uncharacterized protein LOC141597996 [Silene latifolia]|uniref:uncharacterized protein LOC141597996 n=1 Tax=Silene latifolia TaxID=37657 RepID=UPI003D77630E